MKIKELIKITCVVLTLSSFFTCHPYKWQLDEVHPDCPTVESLLPNGAEFDAIVTVIGSNFLYSAAAYTLTIHDSIVPILDIVDKKTLRFKVPKGIGSGAVKVAYKYGQCTGDAKTSKLFTYYVTATSAAVFAGTRGNTTCANCLSGPRGMDVDASGNLYVADREHQVIKRITPSNLMAIIAGQNNMSGAIDNPLNGLGATFANPSDVAVDPSGNIYVADENNNSIRKISVGSSWPVQTMSGTTTPAPTPGGVLPPTTLLAARYNKPTGIATDSSGKVYVVEYLGHRLRVLDIGANQVTTLAGTGSASSSELNFPTGVDCLPRNSSQGYSIYVADFENKLVRAFDKSGAKIQVPTVAVSPFSSPTDVALDSRGNIFVVDKAKKQLSIVYPNGHVGQILGYNFDSPYGIVFDEKNKMLYVSDNIQHLIVKFSIE